MTDQQEEGGGRLLVSVMIILGKKPPSPSPVRVFLAVFTGMLDRRDSSEAVMENRQRYPNQPFVIPSEFFIPL